MIRFYLDGKLLDDAIVTREYVTEHVGDLPRIAPPSMPHLRFRKRYLRSIRRSIRD